MDYWRSFHYSSGETRLPFESKHHFLSFLWSARGFLAPATCPPLQEPGEEHLACGLCTRCGQVPHVPGLESNRFLGRWKLTAVGVSDSQLCLSTASRTCLKFQNLIIMLSIKIRGVGGGRGKYWWKCVGPQAPAWGGKCVYSPVWAEWILALMLMALCSWAPKRQPAHCFICVGAARDMGLSCQGCKAGPWEMMQTSQQGLWTIHESLPGWHLSWFLWPMQRFLRGSFDCVHTRFAWSTSPSPPGNLGHPCIGSLFHTASHIRRYSCHACVTLLRVK